MVQAGVHRSCIRTMHHQRPSQRLWEARCCHRVPQSQPPSSTYRRRPVRLRNTSERTSERLSTQCQAPSPSKPDSSQLPAESGPQQQSPSPSGTGPAAAATGRLFSNLNVKTLQHEPGTVMGAAALVAGTTVGAGILALPFATQEAGFVASSGAIVACAAYAVMTGLLLAEVCLNTMCELGAGGVSLTAMAGRTLGRPGTLLASGAYLFLHYALLVAYISRGGGVLAEVAGLPPSQGSLLFTLGLGGLCYGTSARALDSINGGLVALVVASFLGLLGVAGRGVDPEALLRADWGAVPQALPVIALAFVYQNVVPVIASSLEGDPAKIRTSIIIGVALPLAMFLAWDAAILGTLGDPSAASAAAGAATGGSADPLAVLAAGSPLMGSLIRGFSLLAIATSFIGFVLGLSDFLAGALNLPSGGKLPLPYLLTLAPPLLLALSYPDLFFGALDFAGTYGVLVLFGIVPAVMAWSERYGGSTLSRTQLVPGGRIPLLASGSLAAAVIGHELWEALP